MRRSLLAQLMLVALGVIAAATVIAMVELWPRGPEPTLPANATRVRTERAVVEGVERSPCPNAGGRTCVRVKVKLKSGRDEGELTSFTLGEARGDPILKVGDDIRVFKNPVPENGVVAGVRIDPYGFSDYERRSPMFWLALGFAALVVATGRWRGLRALAGLAGSIGIVVWFVIPAILDGGDPLGVAIVGALAVMLVTIPLAHGLGAKALAACLGTTLSLLLTAGLASTFTDLAHLSGISSEETAFLGATGIILSLQGLLLAGMVIGALGVLDDLTVSQASTVMALRRANPALKLGRLIREAMSVGHDHIAATVNTLVLAYAGASLPVLLIFGVGDTPFADAINTEAVAEQVVGMLVGSIGQIAAVPLTTVLAALLALDLPERALREEHAHVH
jgi:uncharacterized membrane protein